MFLRIQLSNLSKKKNPSYSQKWKLSKTMSTTSRIIYIHRAISINNQKNLKTNNKNTLQGSKRGLPKIILKFTHKNKHAGTAKKSDSFAYCHHIQITLGSRFARWFHWIAQYSGAIHPANRQGQQQNLSNYPALRITASCLRVIELHVTIPKI